MSIQKICRKGFAEIVEFLSCKVHFFRAKHGSSSVLYWADCRWRYVDYVLSVRHVREHIYLKNAHDAETDE